MSQFNESAELRKPGREDFKKSYLRWVISTIDDR